MKKLVFLFVITAAACGGKGNGSATPSNAGGTTPTEPKKDGAPMGGATYGSAATTDPCAAPADPCAAPPH